MDQAPVTPQPTAITRPFWEGCGQGEFRLQRCNECGHLAFYPRAVCANCFGTDLGWQAANGQGTVLSYTVVHRGPGAAWVALQPYVIAVIQLDEGPTVMSRMVNCQPADVQVGTTVQVVFLQAEAGLGVPVFQPAVPARPDAMAAASGHQQ